MPLNPICILSSGSGLVSSKSKSLIENIVCTPGFFWGWTPGWRRRGWRTWGGRRSRPCRRPPSPWSGWSHTHPKQQMYWWLKEIFFLSMGNRTCNIVSLLTRPCAFTIWAIPTLVHTGRFNIPYRNIRTLVQQ